MSSLTDLLANLLLVVLALPVVAVVVMSLLESAPDGAKASSMKPLKASGGAADDAANQAGAKEAPPATKPLKASGGAAADDEATNQAGAQEAPPTTKPAPAAAALAPPKPQPAPPKPQPRPRPDMRSLHKASAVRTIDVDSAEPVKKMHVDTVVAVPDDKNGFYINIELTKEGKKKLLRKTVEDETGGHLPSFMAGAAADLAGVVVRSKTIINEVAGELVSAMPAEVGAAGIDLELKKRFVDGNLAVLHARVKNINLDKGVKEEYGEAGCQHFDKMMAALDFFDVQEEKKEVLDEMALEIVGEMRKEMQTSLPKEFAKEGLECVVEVVGEAEEAEYMLSQLERQKQKK